MEFIKKTIDGESLAIDLNIDLYELYFLTLKHNLTVLEIPVLTSFNEISYPKYNRVDTESLLKIIQIEPTWLYEKLFFTYELQNIVEFERISSPYVYYEERSFEKQLMPLEYHPEFTSFEDKMEIVSSFVDEKLGDSAEDEIQLYNQSKQKQKDYPSSIKNIIEDHEDNIKENFNVFSLLGKVWFVKYQQKEWSLFPDKEKYHYIFHLLKLTTLDEDHAELSIYNTDLILKIKEKNISIGFYQTSFEDELHKSELDDPIDPSSFQSIKDIGFKLFQELTKAKKSKKTDEVKEKQKLFDKYRSYLFNEYGIKCNISSDESEIYFKRYHRPSGEIEKLRQLIKNQIRNAINDIKDCMPSFGRHLVNSLKTKSYKTLYLPEDRIRWHVST